MMSQLVEPQFKRTIKSYVLRSRMTPSQQIALEKYSLPYVIDPGAGVIDFSACFQRVAPTVLEIGFGMGTSLIALAQRNPAINFLGIEVHKPGVGSVLAAIAEKQLKNLRIICADAVEILKNNIAESGLLGILLFFPDPWPKRRHHKRRIVQPSFVELVYKKLQPKGYFLLATDVPDYRDHMFRTIDNHPGFTIMTSKCELAISLERVKTKFEGRGERLGHNISDLVFVKDAL